MLRKNGRSAPAVNNGDARRGRNADELMTSNWEEFVIRYDREAGRYVTRTACCPGAPICC